MKKLLLPLAFMFATTLVAAQTTTQKKPGTTKAVNKYNDNVDDRMKGPNGEKIFIGEKGGRYYMKNGKKIYVEHKTKKKKA
jgi:hypothetical protein